MVARTVGFAVAEEDAALLERLVQHYGHGNRSEFLRAAMRQMAAAERAERLRSIQADMHASLGRILTQHEVNALVREVVRSARG